MTKSFFHVLDLLSAPWACLPEHHALVWEIFEARLRSENDILKARNSSTLEGPTRGYEVRNGVAVIPIIGTMSQRMNLMSDVSGGASSDLLINDIKAVTQNQKIKGILLKIDSPGGAVAGTQPLASAVFAARKIKPIFAISEGTMASAAYWVGSAAEKVYSSSKTDKIGSIGVLARHIDRSQANKEAGLSVTTIYAGSYKNIGSDAAPLSDFDRQTIQSQVDSIYRIFVEDVASFRRVSPDQAMGTMADGRVFLAQDAVNAGLIDGLATMDELISEITERSKWRPIAPKRSTMQPRKPLPPL
jgi:signal peptide peptidase SppA